MTKPHQDIVRLDMVATTFLFNDLCFTEVFYTTFGV